MKHNLLNCWKLFDDCQMNFVSYLGRIKRYTVYPPRGGGGGGGSRGGRGYGDSGERGGYNDNSNKSSGGDTITGHDGATYVRAPKGGGGAPPRKRRKPNGK